MPVIRREEPLEDQRSVDLIGHNRRERAGDDFQGMGLAPANDRTMQVTRRWVRWIYTAKVIGQHHRGLGYSNAEAIHDIARLR